MNHRFASSKRFYDKTNVYTVPAGHSSYGGQPGKFVDRQPGAVGGGVLAVRGNLVARAQMIFVSIAEGRTCWMFSAAGAGRPPCAGKSLCLNRGDERRNLVIHESDTSASLSQNPDCRLEAVLKKKSRQSCAMSACSRLSRRASASNSHRSSALSDHRVHNRMYSSPR